MQSDRCLGGDVQGRPETLLRPITFSGPPVATWALHHFNPTPKGLSSARRAPCRLVPSGQLRVVAGGQARAWT
jgi:hypothetical protein